MAKRKTRLVRVKESKFVQALRKVESRYGLSSVRSDGTYRLGVCGEERIVGSDRNGKFINVNLIEELGYETAYFTS